MPPQLSSLVIVSLLWATGTAFTAAAGMPLAEPIKPIPAPLPQDPARVQLGQRLFNDKRLSAGNAVSCASCHQLDKGGADGRARSIGFAGQPTLLNTPTVLNAALNFRQFWDGRADSLEAQIDLVIRNPIEMGSNWADVVHKVARDASYAADFAAAYREGVTQASITNALATYERTLTTPDSPFDRYLRGDRDAISDEARAGYGKFKQYGCVACHQGVNVGGNMFQKFGVMGDRAAPRPSDLGRYAVTGEEGDRQVFKVPGLRNVALTAPYFHDASANTLDEAVDVMFRVQLGRTASREDKALIIKFLSTLTGDPGAPHEAAAAH